MLPFLYNGQEGVTCAFNITHLKKTVFRCEGKTPKNINHLPVASSDDNYPHKTAPIPLNTMISLFTLLIQLRG